MVKRERWYREANERQLRDLLERVFRGEGEAVPELLNVVRRSGNAETVLTQMAQRITEEENSGAGSSDEAQIVLWTLSKETGKLPDVPVNLVHWIPDGLEPVIKYTQTWDVVTERSSYAGDNEASGYYDGVSHWTLEELRSKETPVFEEAVSDLLDELRGWDSYNEGRGWSIYFDSWQASEEFGDTWGEEDPDDEEDYDNTVIGGSYTVHLEDPSQFEQLEKWRKQL